MEIWLEDKVLVIIISIALKMSKKNEYTSNDEAEASGLYSKSTS